MVTATIDKYSYVVASASDNGSSEVTSPAQYETNPRADYGFFTEAEVKIRRMVIDHFGLGSGFSAFVASQIPASAGLGSTTAESIALIKAASELSRADVSRRELAELASQIEVDRLHLPLGRQDHYAISFGGLNCVYFTPDGIDVEPITLPQSMTSELERRLMLFFTGRVFDWTSILAESKRRSESNRANAIEALHAMKDTARGLLNDLRRGEPGTVGAWLHRAWLSKKRLVPRITDGWIDQWYESALSAGATGGMVVGPGGGGFLLLDCDPAAQPQVTGVLLAFGLNRVDFRFDFEGASVLLRDHELGAGVSQPVQSRGHGAR